MIDVTVTQLTDCDEFLSQWATVYKDAENRSFFLSPAWMKTWIECAAPLARLHVVKAREGGSLKGICVFGEPLKSNIFRVLREARLHEIGHAGLDKIYIEENDFLIVKGSNGDLRQKMIGAIVDYFHAQDSLVFRNIREGLATDLEKMNKGGEWHYKEISQQPSFIIDLSGDDDGEGLLLASCSASLRSDIRRSIRLYEKRGPLRVELAEDQAQRSVAWNKLVSLHEARWQRVGQAGVFENELLVKFHHRLGEIIPTQIHLLQVYCGGDVIGVLYNFIQNECVLNYQTGFTLEDDNKLKPGMVTHAMACDFYRRKGFTAYDFLAGDSEYKRRLGSESGKLKTVALERQSLRMKTRNLIKRLR